MMLISTGTDGLFKHAFGLKTVPSKQGVSYTDQGHAGYAPICAHVGTEGYLLDCQYRA